MASCHKSYMHPYTKKATVSKRKKEEDEDLGEGKTWYRRSIIGEGGFGTVHEAVFSKQPRLENPLFRLLAVKSTRTYDTKSFAKEREVMDELASSSSSSCSGLIKCLGEEITEGRNGKKYYNLLMEYAAGGNLREHMEKREDGVGLCELEVKQYTKDIVLGLGRIHSQGYVHCDLKLENILLLPCAADDDHDDGRKFRAKICDFGLTKKEVKFEHGMHGTCRYWSPEVMIQSLQEKPSDVWALGCIVIEMLQGKISWESTEDRLNTLFTESKMPDIPDDISKYGKDFLRGCFKRRSDKRWTVKMLQEHPFVTGLLIHDDEDEVAQQDFYENVFDQDEDDWGLDSSFWRDVLQQYEVEYENSELHGEDDTMVPRAAQLIRVN